MDRYSGIAIDGYADKRSKVHAMLCHFPHTLCTISYIAPWQRAIVKEPATLASRLGACRRMIAVPEAFVETCAAPEWH